MDELRIKMHPTLDILCREDGAVMTGKCYGRWKPHWADDYEQQTNMDKTDAVLKAFGVRARDDKKAWRKAYKAARRQCMMEGKQWVAPRFRTK